MDPATDTTEAQPPQATPRPDERNLSTFDALSLPLYRIVWIGTVLSFLAFNMSGTAQGVVAFDLTGSNSAVGTVQFGQGIAMLFLNPFGGAIADRFSKKLLIIIAQVTIGSVMLATAFLLATDHITILLLASGAFIVGSMFSFNAPARTALLGEIVPEEKIGNAMALVQVGGSTARISGPFVAGILLAWPVVGATGVYFIIAAVFILVIGTLLRLPSEGKTAVRETSVLADVRDGISYICHHQSILHCVLSFYILAILGFGYFVLMPGFVKEVLHTGTASLGLLYGTDAAGGLAMGLVVASRANSPRAPYYLMLASFCTGVALICLGQAPSFLAAAVAIMFVGAGASGFLTLNNAVAIRMSARVYYGRVIGIIFLAWGLTNLFGLPIGAMADAWGERLVLSCMGIVLCVCTILLTVWLRLIPSPAPDLQEHVLSAG